MIFFQCTWMIGLCNMMTKVQVAKLKHRTSRKEEDKEVKKDK